jgi:hypothetical protein
MPAYNVSVYVTPSPLKNRRDKRLLAQGVYEGRSPAHVRNRVMRDVVNRFAERGACPVRRTPTSVTFTSPSGRFRVEISVSRLK